MVTVIWISLSVLGFLAIHIIVERLLYHASCDEVETQLFLATHEQWRARRAIRPVPQTGEKRECWMQVLYDRAEGRRSAFELLCHEEKRRAERFDAFLPMLASAATGCGLLGTVVAMASMHGDDMDVATILSVGMGTTKWGLIIAVPVTIVHAVLCKRTARLVEQIDATLALVREIALSRARTSAQHHTSTDCSAFVVDTPRRNGVVKHIAAESRVGGNGKLPASAGASLPAPKSQESGLGPEDERAVK